MPPDGLPRSTGNEWIIHHTSSPAASDALISSVYVVVLGILGLYSLYLLYLGLPRLMKSPAEKARGYTVVVILVAVVLFILIGAVAGRFLAGPQMGMMGR